MLRFAATALVVLHVLLSPVDVRAAGEADNNKPKKTPLMWNHILALSRADSEEDVEALASLCEQALAYQKLGFADAAADFITQDRPRPIPGYTWQKGRHDLESVPGRVAFVLEHIIGQELQPIGPDSTEEDLAAVRRDATRLLDAYRQGMIAVSKEYRMGPSVDDLARKYKGKIDLTWQEDREDASAAAMLDLFEEWMPIGRSIDELEKIVGGKGNHGLGRVSFSFSPGFGSTVFLLHLRGKTITSVEIRVH